MALSTMGTAENVQIDTNLFWANSSNRWYNSIEKNTIVNDPQIAGPSGLYAGYRIAESALTTSPAVDTGINVGLKFIGTGPDIGAFEVGSKPLAAPALKIISVN